MEPVDLLSKRVSLLSLEKVAIKDGQTNENIKNKEPPPPDKYFQARITLLCYGMGSLISIFFVFTANDYWMYKFRDPAMDTYDLNNKTILQKNFTAVSGMTLTLPPVLVVPLSILYGHKILLRTRLLSSMTLLTIFFVIFTLFVGINTDSWQVGFFGLILVLASVMTVCSTMFQLSNLALIAKFPPKYIKWQVIGTSATGIASAIIQVMCLSIGKSSTTVAVIYFITACLLLMLTLCLVYLSKYSAVFNHYLGDGVAETKRAVFTLEQAKKAFIDTWPVTVIMVLNTLVSGISSITSLIVSEGYGESHAWNDKYFIPVVTFLLADIFSLLGRAFARPILTRKTAKWFILASIIRSYVLNPLILFCNAQPRKNLPVLFPHDWQYILILFINNVGTGYIDTCTYIGMPKLANNNTEMGFLIMIFIGGILRAVTSPMGPVFVNIL